MKNKRNIVVTIFCNEHLTKGHGHSLQHDYLPTPGVRTHYARRARNYSPYHGETDTTNGHCLQIQFQ